MLGGSIKFASWPSVTSKRCLIIFATVSAALILAVSQAQAQTDLSPDTPFGAPGGGSVNTGGRIHTLLLDPNPNSHNQILYAASTNAEVWKSTDAAHSWFQASIGISNPFPSLPNGLGNQVLALDGTNSQRLLFVTQGDDGRSAKVALYSGLYVSINGAATWQHAEVSGVGGLCPGSTGEISSVAFSSGRPFVAASCGFFTNPDSGLATGWVGLTTPFIAGSAIIAPNGYGNALFVCATDKVTGLSEIYRSRDLGLSWNQDTPINLAAGSACLGLSIVPLTQQFAPDTLAVVYSYPVPSQSPASTTALDVKILSFGSSPPIDLGFNSVAQTGGSGRANVFAVRRASAPPEENRPGIGYDIFAADGLSFWSFVPGVAISSPLGSFTVPSRWNQLQGSLGPLHSNSWSMAFLRLMIHAAGTVPPMRQTTAAYSSTT